MSKAVRSGPLDRTHWYGYLSIDNHAQVAERLRRMLDGKRYTFVATHEGTLRPQVRVDQRLIKPISATCDPMEDGRRMAHITCVDGRYVWGLSTTAPDERAAADGGSTFDKVMLSFSHDYQGEQVAIEQFNGLGERLHWTVMVQDDDPETTS